VVVVEKLTDDLQERGHLDRVGLEASQKTVQKFSPKFVEEIRCFGVHRRE
jgi:hypothetical protein